MNRIVNSIEEVALVKSDEITLPQERARASTHEAANVDLLRGIKGNGKLDLPRIGCPESNGFAFPISCLEGPIHAITEGTSRQERNPAGLAGTCALGMVSAALGKGLLIESQVNKTCSGNLYLLVGTPSGQGKSETLRPIVKPLRQYEADLTEGWIRNTKPDLEAKERRFKSEIKRFERQLADPKFKGDPKALEDQLRKAVLNLNATIKALSASPCLIVENATSEATAKLLSLHEECLGSISSDARELIDILCGKYTDGKTDESVFIKGYSLEPYTAHRITRENVTLQAPCLACLWLVQPDKIAEVFSRRSLTDGGLLPRFLVCLADYEPQPIDRSIPGLSSDTAVAWDRLIRDLLETYRFATKRFVLKPTPEARDLLDKHFNELVEKRKTTLWEITTFAARWNEQAWRLTVVLHASRYGKHAHEHAVDTQTAQAAIKLVDWLTEHQMWVLNRSDLLAFTKLSRQVIALCRNEVGGITATALYRGHLVPDAAAAHALLEKMLKSGMLECQERSTPGGGHATRIYKVRP